MQVAVRSMEGGKTTYLGELAMVQAAEQTEDGPRMVTITPVQKDNGHWELWVEIQTTSDSDEVEVRLFMDHIEMHVDHVK